MIEKNTMNTKKILRYGLYAYGAFIAGFFVLEMWSSPIENFSHQNFGDQFWGIKSTLPFRQKMGGFLVRGVNHLILLTALYYMSLAISASKFMGMAKNFTKIARLFLVYTIWELASEPMYSLLSTMHLPKGQRLLSVNIGTHHLQWVLIALFFYFLVEQMKKAYLMEREQEMTV